MDLLLILLNLSSSLMQRKKYMGRVLLTSIVWIFKHSKRRHSLLQGHLEYVMHIFELTSPKVSISFRFPMQKKCFSLFLQWIIWFSSLVCPDKLFRNCLTNYRFSGWLFKFLIVYKKKVYWTSIKIKISMNCVYKEYEIKPNMVATRAVTTVKNEVFIGL